MLFKKICPRCANVLSKKDDVCPECGYSFASAKEDEETKVLKFSSEIEAETNNEETKEQEITAEESIIAEQTEDDASVQEDGSKKTEQQDGEVVATSQTKRHKHKKKIETKKLK